MNSLVSFLCRGQPGRVTRQTGRPGREAGLLLIECLVYIGVWLVITGLGMALFYRAMTHWKETARSADDIVRVLRTGEQWRTDVRRAIEAPRLGALDAAGLQEFTLRHREQPVTYRITATNVLRQVTSSGEWIEVLRGVKSSRLLQDRRDGVTSWRWELELQPRARRPAVRPLFTFQAVNVADQTP